MLMVKYDKLLQYVFEHWTYVLKRQPTFKL